jgi:hypothetical protein
MKRNVLSIIAYQRRKAEQLAGFRGCGWKALREGVTEASRAVNCLIPLHLASEEEIVEVAAELERCRQLALAMLRKGRRHGR